MKIESIKITEINIPFKKKFSHADAQRSSANNLIIEISANGYVGYGECLPRKYVTGEDIFLCKKNLFDIVQYFKKIDFENFEDVLKNILKYYKKSEKNTLSAFSGFENALLNLSAQYFNKSIKDVFDFFLIKNKQTITHYTGPISGELSFLSALKIKLFGFKSVKFKVTPNTFSKALFLKKILFKKESSVFDANSSLDEDFFEKNSYSCKQQNIRLEQPFSSKKNIQYFEKNLPKIQIVFDESLCSYFEVKSFINLQSSYFLANLRIGKNGGITNLLFIYSLLKKNNVKITLGCLVGETVTSKYTCLLGKYLNCISYEGGYDKFLFRKHIIKPNIMKYGGILRKDEFDINQKIPINIPPHYIIEQYYLENARSS
ncbi:MAG: hypothetical protein VXZ40_00080 [Nanoarchaeota archaeon]|nr:hypothetical protein [Nanoarchaeota archaeon]